MLPFLSVWAYLWKVEIRTPNFHPVPVLVLIMEQVMTIALAAPAAVVSG